MSDLASVHYDGNTMVIRGSAIGYCVKNLVAAKMGLGQNGPGEKMQKAFDLGHEYEAKIIAKVAKDLGKPVPYSQGEAVLKLAPGVEVRGHVDGLEEFEFWEVKFLASSEYKKYKAGEQAHLETHRIYSWQNSAYMHALKRKCRYIIAEKVKDEWTGEYVMFIVEKPIVSKKDLIEKALFVKNAEELPACDFVQYPCGFAYLHTEDDVRGIKDFAKVDEENGPILDMLQAKLEKAKEMIATGEREKKEAYIGIKAIVEMEGSSKIRSDYWKVSWVRQERKGYDWEAMPEGIKMMLDEWKTKVSVSEWPKVTKVKKGDDGDD